SPRSRPEAARKAQAQLRSRRRDDFFSQGLRAGRRGRSPSIARMRSLYRPAICSAYAPDEGGRDLLGWLVGSAPGPCPRPDVTERVRRRAAGNPETVLASRLQV